MESTTADSSVTTTESMNEGGGTEDSSPSEGEITGPTTSEPGEGNSSDTTLFFGGSADGSGEGDNVTTVPSLEGGGGTRSNHAAHLMYCQYLLFLVTLLSWASYH